MAEVKPLSPGLIDLGAPAGAVARLANYATALVKSGQPIPESPFIEWAADRVCGDDRQDLIFFLQGRRGSGKSYSCLYLGKRLGEAIARRKGGTWENYFSLDNCCTLEDGEGVARLLNNAGKTQVVLVDDCSLAISNRAWNSPQNRNFNALLSVCRTNRWVLLLTAPLRSHVDNQTRELCDLTGVVFKSFHKGGFNVLKITSSEISVWNKNKEYSRKMRFSDKKIDYWVTFAPDKELAKHYDLQRDEGTKRISTSIVETGTFQSSGRQKSDNRSRTEKNIDRLAAAHGTKIKDLVAADPGISTNALAIKCGVSVLQAGRLCERLGIERDKKKRGSQK